MVRRACQARFETDNAIIAVGGVTRREATSIRKTHDELASARCPLCRGVLIARQGRAGPYFHCRCLQRVKNVRS